MQADAPQEWKGLRQHPVRPYSYKLSLLTVTSAVCYSCNVSLKLLLLVLPSSINLCQKKTWGSCQKHSHWVRAGLCMRHD